MIEKWSFSWQSNVSNTIGLLVVVAVASLAGCGQKASSLAPLPSPNGRFVLNVTLDDSDKSASPLRRVSILDPETQKTHQDPADVFEGAKPVSATWDEDNRPWLHDTNDGAVYFWEQKDGKWRRTRWGTNDQKEIQRQMEPPEGLLIR